MEISGGIVNFAARGLFDFFKIANIGAYNVVSRFNYSSMYMYTVALIPLEHILE